MLFFRIFKPLNKFLFAWLRSLHKFFHPQNSLEAEIRRGTRSRCILCPISNRSQSRHKCQVCHGACCQSHCFSNCQNCLTDSVLKVAIPITVRPYKPKRIQCKFHGCNSKTARHCDRCLLSYCKEHLYVVCNICSHLSCAWRLCTVTHIVYESEWNCPVLWKK